MGSLAMPSALVVIASMVFGALGERRMVLPQEEEDTAEEKVVKPHLHEIWRPDGSGNWTPTEHHFDDAAMASFIQQRRAERHAAAKCTKGQESPKATFMGTDKKSFKINKRKCLNSGAFGDVYSTTLGDSTVALKQQDLSADLDDGLYVFRSEVKTHDRWAMDGFVRMKGHFETANTGFMYLEMATRGDLNKAKAEKRVVVTRASGSEGKGQITLPELLDDLVAPLITMHHEGWAHRDLKLGNVLMFQGDDRVHGKLADLGMACLVVRKNGDPEGYVKYEVPSQADLRAGRISVDTFWPRCTYVGRCGGVWVYMPPEHLTHTLQAAGKKPCTQKFTRKGDVWMLGVMLAELAGYKPPTFGLGWAMAAANEELGRRITAAEVRPLGSTYEASAQLPIAFGVDFPTPQQLDIKDQYWEANGCLKALLKDMLKPEADRLEMLQVGELVVKWRQGEQC